MLILQLGLHFSESDGSDVRSLDSTLWNGTNIREGGNSGIKLQVAVDRSIHVEAKYRHSRADRQQHSEEETVSRVWHSVSISYLTVIFDALLTHLCQPKVDSDPRGV